MIQQAWEVASSDDSIFRGLYNATIEEMTKAIKLGDYTAVIEVGSGTGDVIGSVKTALPRCVPSSSLTSLRCA